MCQKTISLIEEAFSSRHHTLSIINFEHVFIHFLGYTQIEHFNSANVYCAVQSQKAVSAYIKSK